MIKGKFFSRKKNVKVHTEKKSQRNEDFVCNRDVYMHVQSSKKIKTKLRETMENPHKILLKIFP